MRGSACLLNVPGSIFQPYGAQETSPKRRKIQDTLAILDTHLRHCSRCLILLRARRLLSFNRFSHDCGIYAPTQSEVENGVLVREIQSVWPKLKFFRSRVAYIKLRFAGLSQISKRPY